MPMVTAPLVAALLVGPGSVLLASQVFRLPEELLRRLTPRECARLMGFPDELPIVVSDTQAYRQFGNALVPQIASEVARRVVAVFRWHMETRGLSQFRAVAPTDGAPDRKQEVRYAVAAG